MNFKKSYIVFFGWMLVHLGVYAQISPGDLSKAHAHLEGMSNCTSCHELGASVLNTKCLECHTEIQTTLNNQKGFHFSDEVFGKDCIQCHSEHHGRKFNLIRFDTLTFNHASVGYPLKGKHLEVDCTQCHKPQNITLPDLKEKSQTYLGLAQECTNCHTDPHQKTLGDDCIKCHDMKGFDAVPNFNHNEASFALLGAHQETDCISCHEKSLRNGKEFQQFSGVTASSCVDCHQDPHNNQLPGECNACHRESSFSSIKKKGFAHSKLTDFSLKGKHTTLDCFTCHQQTTNPLLVFQHKNKVTTNACASCHQDIHQPSLGNSCAECHNENGFTQGIQTQNFNHNLTNYPLVGKHTALDCKSCHKESITKTLAYESCTDCHQDAHRGEFLLTAQNNCDACHDITQGFNSTTFGFDKHNQLTFKLEGAHMATPCSSCHLSTENKWTFKKESDCIQCHEDQHQGAFAIAGNTDCSRCHLSDNWNPSNFNHQNTRFPLDGKHALLECAACHLNSQGTPNYQLNKLQCVDCHSS